jgi:hypothetical protein
LKKRLVLSLLIFCTAIFWTGCPGGNDNKNAGSQTNTPPFIKSAEVMPETPVQGSRLTLRVQAGDKEGNGITYTVKWFLNGQPIGEGMEFYLGEAKRGDLINAEVTASDGKASSEPVRTAVVTIGNTSPQILSAQIHPDTILTSTGTLSITGNGIDPDGDSIRWVCRWKVDGNRVLPDTGLTINLADLKLKKGSLINADLSAYDQDTVSLPYQLEISVVNSHPILTNAADSIPYKPGSIYFPVPIADPEGDAVTFELLNAPTGLQIDKKTGLITGSPADSGTFTILVRATDSEGAYLDARFTLAPP